MMILERMHSMLKWNIKGHRYCGSIGIAPSIFTGSNYEQVFFAVERFEPKLT